MRSEEATREDRSDPQIKPLSHWPAPNTLNKKLYKVCAYALDTRLEKAGALFNCLFHKLRATETGTPFANTLFKMLDDQECRLDSKYARVFTKKKNIPIIMIMIANEIRKCLRFSRKVYATKV